MKMEKMFVVFIAGFLFAFLLRLIIIGIREKKGRNEIKYKSLTLTSKMKIVIREIVFKFSILKFNRDFLLNIKLNGQVVMQVLHRSHFPELIKNVSDVKFGLAIYVPTKPLTKEQRQDLLSLLREESEQFSTAEYPIEYFVIDAGSRARYNGYLIARIIKEVFKKDDVDLELSDEGVLPYNYKVDFPRREKGKD